jgi:hypothetical protein
MKAKSIQGNVVEEIGSGLQATMNEDFVPTLAIVFTTIEVDRTGLSSIFSKQDIKVFGVTACKDFIDSGSTASSISVLLMELDPNHFELGFCEKGQEDFKQEANLLTKKMINKFSKPAFILSASYLVDGEQILRGIEEIAGSDTTIFGGIASDDFTMQESFVYTNETSSNEGIILLAIDTERYSVIGSAVCGWKPSGTVKTITESDGRWIKSIDGKPALDTVIKFLGLDVKQKGQIDAVDLNIMSSYPLHLHRTQGVPIMRPMAQFDWENRSIMTDGRIEAGAKIQFSVSPDFDIIDVVLEDCQNIKENELQDADALIMFNCAGRLFTFGPLINKELEGLYEIYNVPTVGLFTYGEFGRAKNGGHEFHNLTCCWVGIKEK